MGAVQPPARVELGKSGVMVSPLGIGTWAWGDSLYWQYGHGYGENDLRQAFQDTLRAGIDFFDTAEVYGFGKSERFIGKFRQEFPSPNPLRIATKFLPLPYRLTRGFLLNALRGSLKRLRVERVDLYQMHWAMPPVPIEAWMDAMAQAVHLGLTRAVGVSNYDADKVRRAHTRLARHGIPLASNQIEYSLLQRRPDYDGVVETCRELGVSIIGYSPLKYGILTGKYTPEKPLPGARGRRFDTGYLARVQPLLKTLRELSDQTGKTLAQVALRWVMQRGAIPIPGAKNARQADENAGALGWELTGAQMNILDEHSASLATTHFKKGMRAEVF